MSKKIPINQQALYVYAALQNLQHERSTLDLAEELGVSRFMVGRMIRKARELGLVEVVSRLSSPIDSDLSQKLAQQYGLSGALVVVPASESDKHAREAVAHAAAEYLSDNVVEDSLIGLGPGRTIVEVCRRISELPPCDVVQLTGVATRDAEESIRAIYELSRVSEGRMFPLHAPLLATTIEAARAIVLQPNVMNALTRLDRLDLSVLTIGGWPDSSLLSDMLKESGELAHLMELGGIAEIGTTILNRKGQVLHEMENRVIGITATQLSKVRFRIALGGGIGKRDAIMATLNSGLIDMIVTDSYSAKAALEG